MYIDNDSLITAKQSKPRVLLYCPGGYHFYDIFEPILYSIKDTASIDLLISDYYMTETTKAYIEELMRKSLLNVFRILPPAHSFNNKFREHRFLVNFLKDLFRNKYSLVLLGTDFNFFDRYIIHFARMYSTAIVQLSTGTMWRVLKRYREKKAELPLIVLFVKRAGLFLKSIYYYLRNFKKQIFDICDFYLYPLLLLGRVFTRCNMDKLGFSSGRADVVICYDKIEYAALKTLVPKIKELVNAFHPAESFVYEAKSQDLEKRSLLVSFSHNLNSELTGRNYDFWLKCIKEAAYNGKVEEVHLRFHPRVSPKLQWTKRICDDISSSGCVLKVINSLETPLLHTINLYCGLLSGPSGCLRVARAANKNIFLIGLSSVSEGGPDDQEWILGEGEGIRWVQMNENLTEKHLKPVAYYQVQKQTVQGVLNNILQKRIGAEIG